MPLKLKLIAATRPAVGLPGGGITTSRGIHFRLTTLPECNRLPIIVTAIAVSGKDIFESHRRSKGNPLERAELVVKAGLENDSPLVRCKNHGSW